MLNHVFQLTENCMLHIFRWKVNSINQTSPAHQTSPAPFNGYSIKSTIYLFHSHLFRLSLTSINLFRSRETNEWPGISLIQVTDDTPVVHLTKFTYPFVRCSSSLMTYLCPNRFLRWLSTKRESVINDWTTINGTELQPSAKFRLDFRVLYTTMCKFYLG